MKHKLQKQIMSQVKHSELYQMHFCFIRALFILEKKAVRSKTDPSKLKEAKQAIKEEYIKCLDYDFALTDEDKKTIEDLANQRIIRKYASEMLDKKHVMNPEFYQIYRELTEKAKNLASNL